MIHVISISTWNLFRVAGVHLGINLWPPYPNEPPEGYSLGNAVGSMKKWLLTFLVCEVLLKTIFIVTVQERLFSNDCT